MASRVVLSPPFPLKGSASSRSRLTPRCCAPASLFPSLRLEPAAHNAHRVTGMATTPVLQHCWQAIRTCWRGVCVGFATRPRYRFVAHNLQHAVATSHGTLHRSLRRLRQRRRHSWRRCRLGDGLSCPGFCRAGSHSTRRMPCQHAFQEAAVVLKLVLQHLLLCRLLCRLLWL